MSKKMNKNDKKAQARALDEKKVVEIKEMILKNMAQLRAVDAAKSAYKKAIFDEKNVVETDALLYAYDKEYHEYDKLMKETAKLAKSYHEEFVKASTLAFGEALQDAVNEAKDDKGAKKSAKAKAGKKEAK